MKVSAGIRRSMALLDRNIKNIQLVFSRVPSIFKKEYYIVPKI